MKILITGESGFIGKNLKEQLVSDDYEVHAPTSTELNLLDNSKVSQYLKEHYFDVILHAATWAATRTSTKDITRVFENNIRIFFNIARCNKDFGKMIYYGSGAEFSREHWKPKMSEDYFDAYIPTDQYGFSKYIMNKHAEKSKNIYNLRLFGIFGKYEDWKIRFISNAICKVIYDLPITIKQNVFFDYMYIDDLVEITKWFIYSSPKYKSYNICTGQIYDLRTLAIKVIEASSNNLNIFVGCDGMSQEYSGDNSRFISEIGGYSFRDMNDCIRELYHWYKSNKHHIDKERLLKED